MINDTIRKIYNNIIELSKKVEKLHAEKVIFVKKHFNISNYPEIDINDIEDNDYVDINYLEESDFDNNQNYMIYEEIMSKINFIEKTIVTLCKENSILVMNNDFEENTLSEFIRRHDESLIFDGTALCDGYSSYVFRNGYIDDIYLKRIDNTNFGIAYSLEDNSEYLFYIRNQEMEMTEYNGIHELTGDYLLLCKLNTVLGYTTFNSDEYNEENEIKHEDFKIIDENRVIIKVKHGKEYFYFLFERTMKKYYYQEPYDTEGKWGTFFHHGGWRTAIPHYRTDDVIECPSIDMKQLSEEKGLEIWEQNKSLSNLKKLTLKPKKGNYNS